MRYAGLAALTLASLMLFGHIYDQRPEETGAQLVSRVFADQDVQPAARRPKAVPAPAPRCFPTVEYEADLRGFVFNGGLTNKSGRLYGEHPDWARGVPGTVYNHLDNGLYRTILRQPVGPGTPGWVLFTSWEPLTDAQKDDFRKGVGGWLGEDYRRRVGVFFGRDCTNPFVRRDVGVAEGPLLPPQPNDPTALLWWRQNTDPLRAIGVSEFWLDRGSASDRADTRVAIVHLARRMRLLQGIKIGVEAIPMKLNVLGNPDRALGPDWDYLTKVPAMGRWRYLWHAWIKHGYRHTLVVPPELFGKIEVHVFLTLADDPPPTTGDRDWLEAAGWTISWLNKVVELPEGPITEP